MSGRILGAVLAGGASSRFGSDKALAAWGGRTLLDRARETLAEVTEAMVVVGWPGGVPDRPMASLGPLGGIAGALDHAALHDFDSVLTIGCDMPQVPASLLAALRDASPSYCEEAPVLGHWPVHLRTGLIARLAPHASLPPRPIGTPHDGTRHPRSAALSIRRWAADVGAHAIPAPFPLANINTPADLPTA